MKENNEMILFFGNEDIYSNFYPCVFVRDNYNWSNSEQYFMWRKALYFEDFETADLIKQTHDNPYGCKKLGRKVKKFKIDEWMKICKSVMFDGCFSKFSQNEDLKKQILSTGDKLFVEASPYDKIWGIGLDEYNPDAFDINKWQGQNLLGVVLKNVRHALRHSI